VLSDTFRVHRCCGSWEQLHPFGVLTRSRDPLMCSVAMGLGVALSPQAAFTFSIPQCLGGRAVRSAWSPQCRDCDAQRVRQPHPWAIVQQQSGHDPLLKLLRLVNETRETVRDVVDSSGIKRSYQESRCYLAKDVPISEKTKKESCR